MTPQIRSPLVLNMSGPGRMPNMMRAPSMSAVVPEPGMPKANIGTMFPETAALFADSGPATPSMAPWPKRSGVLETFFSTI